MTENTGQMQFEAGLATLFDMKSVEEENCPKKLSSDKLYYLQGGSVFLPRNNISGRNSDPFKPPELSKRGTSNKGASPKVMAKPRKPSRILQTLQSNSNNEPDSFASEKRNTKRIRKNIRITKEQGKEEQSNFTPNSQNSFFSPIFSSINSFSNNNSFSNVENRSNLP
ncbi:unnamed protein product [Rhizophagus irregularis]|nr:unnamed protein product [Rhizophagus irregularis]